MHLNREIRYYASISKLVWYLLGSLAFVLIGWLILNNSSDIGDIIMSWLCIVFFGLGVVVFLMQIVNIIIKRQPILRINSAGITSADPLGVRKARFVPWGDVARISVRVQSLPRGNKQYYFLVEARQSESDGDPNKPSLTARMYPSLAHAAITVILNQLSFMATRKRRTQLLERIETTFAPEIIQYNVVIDKVERPL